MSDTPRFDLVDIAHTLRRRSRFILIVTLLAGICGAAAWLIGKRKYKASASVLVANPLYSDRNNLFRNDKVMFVDYFGREDDIDKVLAVAKSDQTKGVIINYMQLAKEYGYDTSKEDDRVELFNRFKRSFEIKRTEYQNVEIAYTDTDPRLAANVTNNAVRIIDEIYSGYYNALRSNARRTLLGRMQQTDSIINNLTDSLAAMRDRHHIYDVMSPSRMNMSSSQVAHGGGPGYGRAIEEIQNIEATKDQLVMDRARFVSLINEFSAGTAVGDQPQIQVISPASVPDKAAGLNLVMTIIVSLLAGAFFVTLWVLLAAYFRALTSVAR
jgi:uncharacterized protein involved in exopolysaccharide biosynthesis